MSAASKSRYKYKQLRTLSQVFTGLVVFMVLILLLAEAVRWGATASMSDDAWVINQAGRQRMLSQLIVTKAKALAAKNNVDSNDDQTLVEMLRTVSTEFRVHHDMLKNPQESKFGRIENPNQIDLLFQEIEPHFENILNSTDDILAIYENEAGHSSVTIDAYVEDVEHAAQAFLPIMDDIVLEYEHASDSRLFLNQVISWMLTIVMIALLLVAAWLVKPLFRQVLLSMVASQRALRKAQRASKEAAQLASFAKHSTNAMVRTDNNRLITWVNEGFTRLTGYSLDECRGKSPGALLQTKQTDRDVILAMRKTLDRGDTFRGRIFNRSKNGRDYWLDLEIIPEFDSEGKLTGFISIESDVTELVQINERTVQAKLQADAANRAKSEFLANMSHEIRTPMTAILGYTELLATDFVDDPLKSKEAILTIQSNANHLLTIINDILDVSKLEAGQFTLEKIPTSPMMIVEETASISRPHAIKKNITLNVCYDTPIPTEVTSDPTRVRQILLNLVSNAIKFTHEGSVTIRLSYDKTNSKLVFRVTDTGIGMTPEQRDAIAKFAAFQQADTSTSRKFGGTGLGLHISSALTHMLGGCLEVESIQGEGTTFVATIQAEHPEDVGMWSPDDLHSRSALEAAKLGERQKRQVDQVLKGVKIFLAEDGPDNQRLLRHHLEKSGANVTIFGNGQLVVDAINLASEAELPNLVLMDMQMPELDGYQATRLLRRQGFSLPIIALTAHAMEGDRQKCLEVGCDDYVSKPINRSHLVETCKKYSAKIDGNRTSTLPRAAYCDVKDMLAQMNSNALH